MRYDLLLDPGQGTVTVVGRSGRVYPLAAIDHAEVAAARGDPRAAELLADIDGDERETIDDCPMCRAERERPGPADDLLDDRDGEVVLEQLERWSRVYARRARRRGGG
jgi:hypothetical protein